MDVKIVCPCPPDRSGAVRHPNGDTVVLRDRLGFHQATTIRKAMGLVESDDPESRPAEILAVLSEYYILQGVESWTFVDDKGHLVPVSQSAIRTRLLEAVDVGQLVEAADDLYNEVILLPLLARASRSSPPMPTPDLTSVPTDSTRKPRRPSRPSSTSTTPTVGIETTSASLGGVSSSLPRSESAA